MAKHDSPPKVVGALKALDRDFFELYIMFGNATHALCRWWLHSGDWNADDDYYAAQFNEWCNRYPAIAQRYSDTVSPNTLPALFRAHFDFWLEMVAIEACRIFAELVEIGREHETDEIGWAEAHVIQLIERYRPLVPDWVRAACNVVDPWQAPALLTMKPAGHEDYNPNRVWDCVDAATTAELLEGFAAEYEYKLKGRVGKAAGDASKAEAKRGKTGPSKSSIKERTQREDLYSTYIRDFLKFMGDMDAKPVAARKQT